ncbi:MAG: winged helix-turn-helix transcriptional regulator [Chloroflexi bacterium]|nr:winged helix-turn-helix transcriptional regulator [Chloroflexota bacterium]
MPLHGIEVTDEVTSMMRFRTSVVYEMLISLTTLLDSRRHIAWANSARETLPSDFWDELRVIVEPFHQGRDLLELAVNYPNHDDVPGFIEYVRSMDEVNFIFHLAGRVVPLSTLENIELTVPSLTKVLEHSEPNYYQYFCENVPMDKVTEDIPAFQKRLTDLWQIYWDTFFSSQVSTFYPVWEKGLIDKEELMARSGGRALLDQLLGNKKLPLPLPADYPFTEIALIPVYRISTHMTMFFGYGNITILFDSERTAARLAQIEEAKEETLATLKALGDATRLKILQLIARSDGKMNGKKIAELLNLSASAVSRHLAQLKDGGLITEESLDNRIIMYWLQKDVISSLPDKLLEYLYD